MGYNQSYGAGTSVLLGSLSGWHLKSQSPNESLSIDTISRDSDGHYLTDSRHVGGQQKQITEVWEPDGDNAGAPSVTIGDDGAKCIESASLRCTTTRPELTIVGHVHEQKADNAATHIGDSKSVTFEFPSQAYGTVNPFPGAGISDISDYEITESTQTFAVNHIDEPGRDGEFLVGASRGIIRTGSMNVTTANTVDIGAGNNGWKITTKNPTKTNDGVVKMTVTGTQYLSTKGS